MSRYLIVIEKGANNYSAFCPDLPGCVATGKALKETQDTMRKAISFHLEGLRKEGLSIAPQTTTAEYIEV